MKTETEAQRLEAQLLPYIDDPNIPTEKKVVRVVHATAAVCALVAIQPIPFADIFILTPIQIVMVTLLGRVYGVRMTRCTALSFLDTL